MKTTKLLAEKLNEVFDASDYRFTCIKPVIAFSHNVVTREFPNDSIEALNKYYLMIHHTQTDNFQFIPMPYELSFEILVSLIQSLINNTQDE